VVELMDANVTRILARLHARCGTRLAATLVGAFTLVISLFLAFPPLSMFLEKHPGRLEIFSTQCANPLIRQFPTSENYLALRVFVPALAYLTGLRGAQGLVIILLANIGSLVLIYLLFLRYFKPEIAFYGTLGLGLTVVCQASNLYPGFPDSVSNLFILFLLYRPSRLLFFTLPMLALVNDERFLVGLPLVFLFHVARKPLSEWFRCSCANLLASAAGLALGYGARYALIHGLVERPIQQPLYPQMGMLMWGSPAAWAAAWLLSFKGWWLIPLLLAVRYPKRASGGVLILSAGCLCAGMMAATTVQDIWRSMGQLFPAFIICGVLLQQANQAFCEKAFRILLLLNLLLPTVYVTNAYVGWARPFPIAIAEYAAGRSLGSALRARLQRNPRPETGAAHAYATRMTAREQ
jgi:hypothetical protein